MWALTLLQRRLDLCCLFNIAQNTVALSHLSKQVIAISIIYSDIQWSGPQTILTSWLTEINAAAHKQADPPTPPLSRLYLFLFSSVRPVICFLLHSFYHLFFPFAFLAPRLSYCFFYLFYAWTKNEDNSLWVGYDSCLTLEAAESWITLSTYWKEGIGNIMNIIVNNYLQVTPAPFRWTRSFDWESQGTVRSQVMDIIISTKFPYSWKEVLQFTLLG